jgi:hypothetical protein
LKGPEQRRGGGQEDDRNFHASAIRSHSHNRHFARTAMQESYIFGSLVSGLDFLRARGE